ncbi:hypothetical protein [Amycolatopsis sp. YIM 10]|uniref:hypothetical protein n=1 Tax=Amycolatopsis sp. YIM 10 TaxID=2653857 RepID=UPI00128FD217|nr:hypothetical protein [Amycolatopsis sp. YIM 10]QFU88417.1 hypothetical protein YIM_16185 [Amycolatopsis sp. YIM 10]
MSATVIWSLALVALAGFLAAYWSNLRLARRRDRLERVNEQLKDLYGPLLALISAADSAWWIFRADYRPNGAFWDQDDPPTEAEGEAWRLWISTVFMPLNRQMRDLIVTKAPLFDEESVPKCLLDLCAHVSAYEPILVSWDSGNFALHKPARNFPRDQALHHAQESFRRLKSRQQQLLRHR